MARNKVFGTSVGNPMDRNEKTRIIVYAKAWNARNKDSQHIGPITRAAFDVLQALLWGFHNQHSGKCFPSYEAIAEKAGCARSTVHEAIKVLERAGILTWWHRLKRAGGRVLRTSNAYIFTARLLASENPARTPIKKIQKDSANEKVKIVVLDPRSPLDAALIRLGQGCGALEIAREKGSPEGGA